MRLGILASIVVGVGLVAVACGGTDDGGLFQGGQAGQDAGTGGGSSGSAGTSGGGGSTGGSGGGVSGSGGAAGGSGGGVSGSGGATGGSGGGVSGSGGDTGGTAGVSGSGGATGGTAGVSGSGGGPGGSGGTGGTTAPSCAGHCGSSQPVPGSNPDCYCDGQCTSVGDCCPDYKTQCAPPGGSVHCGSQSCKLPGSYCCQNWNGSAYVPQCRDSNQSCYGVRVECDGQADCGSGQVCCGQLSSGGNYYTNFMCRAATDCNVNQNRRIICGETSECPNGLTCKQSNLLPAYTYCSSN